MSDAAELSVVFKGKEVGLRSLIAAIERELKQADTQAQKSEQTTAQLANAQQKAAGQALQLASAYARLDVAEGQAATAAQRLRTAIEQNSGASERQIVAAKTQLSNLEAQASGTDRFSQSLKGLQDEAASAAAGMLTLGAGVGVAVQVFQSFADAFSFKAGLDATTNSINIQLKGVREQGQVWNEASAFASKYKLTQEQTTEAIQASVGVLRTSKAPLTDVLGVLGRLQVLSPEQSLSEAALAVKGLASGDITSLVGRFEVSRDVANQMKQEIAGGADAVSVLSKFLDQSGVSMDALASGTTGAAGKIKDLAVAQEQLKLSQAEFAQGPGMAILGAQIDITRGATRLLSGDFGAMGTALAAALRQGDPAAFDRIAAGFAKVREASAGGDAQKRSNLGGARNDAANIAAANAQAQATQAQADADALAAQRAEEHATASTVLTSALSAEDSQQQINTVNSQALSIEKERLATSAQFAAGAVIASGGNIEAEAARLAASSSLVDQLTAAYLRLALANGQVAAAAGKARIADQAKNTRDNSGSIGFNAPGRSGSSDGDILKTIATTQKGITDETKATAAAQRGYDEQIGGTRVKIANLRKDLAGATTESQRLAIQTQIAQLTEPKKGGKGGGSAKTALNAQRTADFAEEDQAKQHQDKLAAIAATGAQKRADADESFRRSGLTGRASFYAGLASITDAAQQKDLAAKYEAIQQEAAAIKQSQGSDVAQAYAAAAEKALQGQSQIEAQIKEASDKKDKSKFDPAKAEYLQGVLALQKAADNDELQSIKNKGSAIASEQAAQYAAEEAAYAAHLDKIATTYERKISALPGLGATLGAGKGQAAGIDPPNPLGTDTSTATRPSSTPPSTGTTPAGQAQPVIDIATPAAVDQQTSQLLGALNTANGLLSDVASRVSNVEKAVQSLKSNRAFAP